MASSATLKICCPRPLAERLKCARKAVGLTLLQVEERTKLGKSSISEWENGTREPSLSQLVQLGRIYRRGTSFFLDEGQMPSDVVLWRQKPSERAAEIEQQLIQLADQYQRLERCCGDPRPENLASGYQPSDPFGYADAEQTAHDFRTRYALGDRPGNVLLRVLEEVCHVKVFHMAFEPSGTAACTRSERFGAAILLNSNNARWRRNFDLAHELFHLLTWDIFRVGDQLQAPTDSEEKFANRFAGRLLMPPEALELAIGKQRRGKQQLDFDDLFEVARQFDVSVQSLLYQMSDAKLMNRDKVPATLEALRPKLEFWDRSQGDTPRVRPLRYETLAREAIEKGNISTGKFAQYMGLSRTAAMSVIASEIWTRPEQEADAQVEVFDS